MNNLNFEKISSLCFSNSYVKWRPYSETDKICSRFSLDEWHKAVFDINSDNEWNELLKKYPQFICCYLLTNLHKKKDVGFIYLFLESTNVISVHGGGWEKSPFGTLSFYYGFFLILESILGYGFKVRTSCLSNNTKAYRFLKSIGFVKYREDEGIIYMWINLKRLHKSVLYCRFK